MTARCDYVATIDYLNYRCAIECKDCQYYMPCKIFSIAFKYGVYAAHTMQYSEGEY